MTKGKNIIFGGFRSLWTIVLFDLPTDTKSDRYQYTRFRKQLISNGFVMLQYSVYTRHCASDESAEAHCKRVKATLPPKGEVRILKITEKQFERMQVYHGKKRTPTEQTPKQLSIF